MTDWAGLTKNWSSLEKAMEMSKNGGLPEAEGRLSIVVGQPPIPELIELSVGKLYKVVPYKNTIGFNVNVPPSVSSLYGKGAWMPVFVGHVLMFVGHYVEKHKRFYKFLHKGKVVHIHHDHVQNHMVLVKDETV